MPWQGGRCLAWDATVDTSAPSYVAVSAQVTDSAAQAAADRKVSKYGGLPVSHLFVLIAIETLGPINEAGHSFLSELERHLSTISDDPRESLFLFQRIFFRLPLGRALFAAPRQLSGTVCPQISD